MTLSPVTLQEFRDELNLDASDDVSDEELWSKLIAAVGMVEDRVGPMRPRTQTSRVVVSGSVVLLPVHPVISVTSITDDLDVAVSLEELWLDASDGTLTSAVPGTWPLSVPGVYTVEYVVGRDPVPDVLADAVLVVARQLWESQRGPSAANRFTAMGGEPGVYRGFAWPHAADELIRPHRLFGVA